MGLLRRRFPRSRVTLVGNPLWLPLVRAAGLFDEVKSLNELPLHAGFMRHLPKESTLGRFLAGFDLIISWFGDREGRWEENLRKACQGTALVQPYHGVHSFQGHVSEYYLMTLKALGLEERNGIGQARYPDLRMSQAEAPEARESGIDPPDYAPFLCLHPGSGSEHKNWPKEDFLEVARGAFRLWRLASVVLIGPAEEGQRTFWAGVRGPFLSVREDLPILEVARILQRATLYVGNDSGITHLAAALGVPLVALFGPTDPQRWGPRGDRVEICSQEISPQGLLEVLDRIHSSIIL
jgi:hypothetical protein